MALRAPPWPSPRHTPGITPVTDLALRRQWPPSPAIRWCTKYFKVALLDAWISQNRDWLGDTIVVALGERAAESPRRAVPADFPLQEPWRCVAVGKVLGKFQSAFWLNGRPSVPAGTHKAIACSLSGSCTKQLYLRRRRY